MPKINAISEEVTPWARTSWESEAPAEPRRECDLSSTIKAILRAFAPARCMARFRGVGDHVPARQEPRPPMVDKPGSHQSHVPRIIAPYQNFVWLGSSCSTLNRTKERVIRLLIRKSLNQQCRFEQMIVTP